MAEGPPSVTLMQDDSVPLGGVYANFANVWHTRFEFTLDFGASLPSGPDELGFALAARVKLPPEIA